MFCTSLITFIFSSFQIGHTAARRSSDMRRTSVLARQPHPGQEGPDHARAPQLPRPQEAEDTSSPPQEATSRAGPAARDRRLADVRD